MCADAPLPFTFWCSSAAKRAVCSSCPTRKTFFLYSRTFSTRRPRVSRRERCAPEIIAHHHQRRSPAPVELHLTRPCTLSRDISAVNAIAHAPKGLRSVSHHPNHHLAAPTRYCTGSMRNEAKQSGGPRTCERSRSFAGEQRASTRVMRVSMASS